MQFKDTKRHPSVQVACEQCGKVTSRWVAQLKHGKHHFCSRACHDVYQGSHYEGKRAEMTEGICQHCGQIFKYYRTARGQTNRKYCGLSCAGKAQPRASLADRFWSKVQKTDGCWIWTGAQTQGYGEIQSGGKPLRAHRVSYELHYGPIPDGLDALHQCDNPPCVRPDHLFLGTAADNSRDMAQKGRCRTKLTPNAVRQMRSAYSQKQADLAQLAAQYGITASTASAAIRGKTWKHVS